MHADKVHHIWCTRQTRPDQKSKHAEEKKQENTPKVNQAERKDTERSLYTVPSSSGQDAVLSAQKTGVRISSAPPYLGVAHLAERSLWKREAEGAAPSAQTISLNSTIGRCNCFKRSQLTVRVRLQGPTKSARRII